jgi:two-component sensor histidine kinase
MVINELITNSIKYAFAEIPYPYIWIDCRYDGGELTIVYQDNGSGTPLSQNVGKGLGTMIIEGLAAQISAEVTMGFDNGYVCTLVIPKEEGQPV